MPPQATGRSRGLITAEAILTVVRYSMGLRLQLLAQVGVVDVQTAFQNPAGDVREDKIDVDGKTRDCWVITTTAPSPWNEQAITWIDKELWIDWKVVTKQHITEVFDIETTLEKLNLTFDPVLPDSLFTFTPPPGSKQFCCRDEILVH
jgi:outer membrane lipoprotein-sorting protein